MMAQGIIKLCGYVQYVVPHSQYFTYAAAGGITTVCITDTMFAYGGLIHSFAGVV
jgi:hypothetical protein